MFRYSIDRYFRPSEQNREIRNKSNEPMTAVKEGSMLSFLDGGAKESGSWKRFFLSNSGYKPTSYST